VDRTGRVGAGTVAAPATSASGTTLDRLEGVTRSTTFHGRRLAGAVDLSALKQPPPSAGLNRQAVRPAAWRITEANIEAE